MPKMFIDDDLFRLKTWVDEILAKSEADEYLDTDDCIDLLNFAQKTLKNVAQQPELPMEES